MPHCLYGRNAGIGVRRGRLEDQNGFAPGAPRPRREFTGEAALGILGASADLPPVSMPPLTPAGTFDRPPLPVGELDPRAWAALCWRQVYLSLGRPPTLPLSGTLAPWRRDRRTGHPARCLRPRTSKVRGPYGRAPRRSPLGCVPTPAASRLAGRVSRPPASLTSPAPKRAPRPEPQPLLLRRV